MIQISLICHSHLCVWRARFSNESDSIGIISANAILRMFSQRFAFFEADRFYGVQTVYGNFELQIESESELKLNWNRIKIELKLAKRFQLSGTRPSDQISELNLVKSCVCGNSESIISESESAISDNLFSEKVFTNWQMTFREFWRRFFEKERSTDKLADSPANDHRVITEWSIFDHSSHQTHIERWFECNCAESWIRQDYNPAIQFAIGHLISLKSFQILIQNFWSDQNVQSRNWFSWMSKVRRPLSNGGL